MGHWEVDLTPSAASVRSAARVRARASSARYYAREATARLPQLAPETPKTEFIAEVKVASKRRPQRGLLIAALALVAILLGVAVICPVLLSSAATDLEVQVGRLEAEQKDLAAAEATLSAQISGLSSPERIAEEADRLGLQPASSVHYVEIEARSNVAEGETTVAGR
jgi:cell division protein FtsL